jgi:hypothetical protein
MRYASYGVQELVRISRELVHCIGSKVVIQLRQLP